MLGAETQFAITSKFLGVYVSVYVSVLALELKRLPFFFFFFFLPFLVLFILRVSAKTQTRSLKIVFILSGQKMLIGLEVLKREVEPISF